MEWFNTKPESVREAMKLVPNEGFYTDAETQKEIYRVYGVIENFHGKGICSYHVTQAGYMQFRETVLKANELVRIDRWSDLQLHRIRLCGSPEIFLNPDGWVTVALMSHQNK